MLRVLLAVVCAVVCAVGMAGRALAEAPVALSIAAYRLGAVDVEASAEFYHRHFGMPTVAKYPSGTAVLIDPAGAYLVLTPATERVSLTAGAAHVRLNFAVPDLEAAAAAMEDAGVAVGARERSAVGVYAAFTDPSGHRHHLKQLDAGGAEEPRIYNAGIVVADMPAAKAFYEGLLGFTPIEGYYPPAVPMEPIGGRQFILSDKGVTGPAGYDLASGALAGLAFETADLDAAVAALRGAGVEFLHDEPVLSFPVRMAAFQDPAGVIHELIEHVTAEEAASMSVRSEPIEAGDFAFLEGLWRSESGGAVVEEQWLAPAHGTISGILRWVNAQGQVTLHEILTITIEDGRGVFRWRHFDGVLKPWDSEKDGPSIVTIESWDHNTLVMHAHPDNPGALARMTYDGSVAGRLTATLEFDAESGRTPIVIAFERVE